MKFTKIKKGEKGYLNQTKRNDILFVILVAVISITIYIIGMRIYKKTANIATVFAILSLLPGCKRVVNFLMLLQFVEIKKAELKRIEEIVIEGAIRYVDPVFSSEKYLMKFEYLVMTNNGLYAYSKMDKTKTSHAKEYLSEGLKKRMIKGNVSISTNIGEYEHLLKSLKSSDEFSNEDLKFFYDTLMM